MRLSASELRRFDVVIDIEKLKDVLVNYKRDFVEKQWPAELYKWEAVKHFKENWNIDDTDFAGMLKTSIAKTYNLLGSVNNFPAKMIHSFAQKAPEEVRAMFIDLFDENKDVYERNNSFKLKSEILLDKHGDGAKQHYQNENSISTYLWLRFPEKYYIYKISEIRKVASELKSSYGFKKGAYADNIRNFLKLYDEICAELHKDAELINLLKSQLTSSCYPDPNLRTLTIDVGFYISRNYAKKSDLPSEDWWPTDYSPGLSVEDWVALLQDNEIFNASSLEIMKRMKDHGGMATCKELSSKYGESVNFYNRGSSSLAKRVAERTKCPVIEDKDDNLRWWPILYVGKKADLSTDGVYTWKLRDELAKALNKIDLSKTQVRVSTSLDNEEHAYWWLNANPKIWSISDFAVGQTQSYTLYNENGNKRRIFQNFIDAKFGDLVVGYESYPVKKIVALAKVSKANDGENLFFEKTEGLASPIDYVTLKNAPELSQMEYFVNPQGSLFKLTKDEYEFIVDLIREQNPIMDRGFREIYSKTEFLNDVFMTEERFSSLLSLLMNKQNLILQGAPGVGKTFAAKRLAYAAMGEKDDSRIELIQFHQNYSYEDFIMGYKPRDTGFELQNGIFFSFCQKAM
jgi:5-methylcytosine-specific restriction protein B